MEYVLESIRAEKPSVTSVTPAVADLIGGALGLLPNPLVERDRFLRMQSDVVLDETAPTKRLHDLGIEASGIETPGFNFLSAYRSGSHFVDIPKL